MNQLVRAPEGLLGPTMTVRGRITGNGDIRIDGRVTAEVAIEGRLVLGEDGTIMSPVSATDVVVAGYLRGNVNATGAVSIATGGRIDGDVKARRVAIDDGATLSGGIEMDFEIPSV